MPPQMWLLKHHDSGSIFAVEYGMVQGKLVCLSHGFVLGNVVSLDTYKRVRARAKAILQ